VTPPPFFFFPPFSFLFIFLFFFRRKRLKKEIRQACAGLRSPARGPFAPPPFFGSRESSPPRCRHNPPFSCYYLFLFSFPLLFSLFSSFPEKVLERNYLRTSEAGQINFLSIPLFPFPPLQKGTSIWRYALIVGRPLSSFSPPPFSLPSLASRG